MSALDLAALDRNAKRQEYLFTVPLAHKLLNDRRDAPALYLLLNVTLLVLPAAVSLHLTSPSHWVGAAYFLINYVLFLQRCEGVGVLLVLGSLCLRSPPVGGTTWHALASHARCPIACGDRRCMPPLRPPQTHTRHCTACAQCIHASMPHAGSS